MKNIYTLMKQRETKNCLLLIIAIVLILILILVSFSSMRRLLILFSSEYDDYLEQQKQNELSEVAEYIDKIDSDYRKNSEKKVIYYVENDVIKKTTNQVSEYVDKIKHKNYYGVVEYKNNKHSVFIKNDNHCFIKNWESDKIKIEEKECRLIDKEIQASEKIIRTSNKADIVYDTIETGLDNNMPYASKYYYKGKKPNNYFLLGNACYRVMSISQNNSLKLIYEGLINENQDCRDITSELSGSVALWNWDNDKTEKRLWNYPVELKNVMDDWIKEGQIDMVEFNIKLPVDLIDDALWYVGEVRRNNTLLEDIQNEREEVIQGKIGLINNSDYAKINCQKSSHNSDSKCKNNNYLYKENYSWWTLNAIHSEDKKSAWSIMRQGMIYPSTIPYSREYSYLGIRPVIYLKNNTKIIGYGTAYAPYQILQKN